MLERIGRFEIQSQLAQSPFATVYKALDSESQQTVALKVVRLDQVKDRAALMKCVFEEAEQAKSLNSPNIAGLYGVGDEDDLLLASMEYIQGNSVATTLARHDGFSIWDLQDIARQVCHALDHAQVHKVVHQSLEPAKIMVQWDGMTKILAFGTSSMNSQAIKLANVPEVLHYAAPEQLRGEKCDQRSAIFSLGAILFEMATEQKAFSGETGEQVRTAILEGTPPLPHRLKPNVNPGLSALIMKALAKVPEERYQTGQELVRDLEQCKAGSAGLGSQTAPAQAKPAPTKTAVAAAAAGIARAPASSPAKASAAPAPDQSKPRFAVDPMMAGAATAAAPASFSDISELPPLKDVHIPAAGATPQEETEFAQSEPASRKPQPEKAKIQIRQAARSAAREIRRTPPKLYLYGVGTAIFLIALYLAGMALYTHFQDSDTGSAPMAGSVAQTSDPKPSSAQSALPPPSEAEAQPDTTGALTADNTQPDTEPQAASVPATGRRSKARKTITRPVAAVVPGQLSVTSTPAGAKIAFDGTELCQTPCTLTGIAPGQHTISASKAGYGTVNRNLAMLSGANSSVALELNALGAALSVSSTPAGAVIVLDGKDTGKLTPSQLTLTKSGTHNITLRRAGYLDGSSSVNVGLGQTANLNLTLTHLGNTDEIRSAGGHFKKVFGGNNGSGMGIVSIKTQPKGAQILVNNRALDKNSPFDFYLNPGTYVIDITMSGYQPLHRVITIQEGEKVSIQETLTAQ